MLKFLNFSIALLTGFAASCIYLTPKPYQEIKLKYFCEDLSAVELIDTAQHEHSNERLSDDLPDVITLQQAIRYALLTDPGLKSLAYEVKAKEALLSQAGLYYNPSLDAELENILGTGTFQYLNEGKLTLQLSQVIDLSAKHFHFAKVAYSEHHQSLVDYELKRIAVIQEISYYFIRLLSLQEKFKKSNDLLDLISEHRKSMEKLFSSGKIAKLEVDIAEASFLRTYKNHSVIKSELQSALESLNHLLGFGTAKITNATGDFFSQNDIPELQQLQSSIENNPEIKWWLALVEKRNAAVDLEKAMGIPDLKVSLGSNYHFNPQDVSFQISLSIELPLFNSNQGNVMAAEYNKQSAIEGKKETEKLILLMLTKAYHHLKLRLSLIGQSKSITDSLKDSMEKVSKGYSEGKFDYLNLITIQKEYVSAELEYLDLLKDYHLAFIELESILGFSLDQTSIDKGESNEN